MHGPRFVRFAVFCVLALASCGSPPPPGDTAKGSESWEQDSFDGSEQSEGEDEMAGSTKESKDDSHATQVPHTDSSSALGPQEASILARHNFHRAEHCAPPLQWSSKLAKVAQSWADQLKVARCAFEHSQQSPYGENLSYFAPVGSRSPDDLVTGWYSEVSEYDFTKGSFGFNTGHFTQVVWQGTRSVGCGMSECNGGELWVCNYDPPGNMGGAFGKNVQPLGCTEQ